MGLFRSDKSKQAEQEPLHAAVSAALPNADEATQAIVVACAGLLAVVAYADRDFSPQEKKRVADLLETVPALDAPGRAAIVQTLERHIVELAAVQSSRFTRSLKQHADVDLRRHLLSLLLEVAAADDAISTEEVKLLRQLTQALGLEQSDYNQAQAQHESKLSVLKQSHRDS